MGDITEVKRRLATQAQSVAEMLLPAGKKASDEWEIGSVAGEPGKSLKVHLRGNKAGIWCDFSTGEIGDLLDLWCQVQNIKLVEALKRARDYLGMEAPKAFKTPEREWKRPPKPKCRAPQAHALDYLREVRNIPVDIITKFKIGEDGDAIIFPFMNPAGELVMAKRRIAKNGEKPIPVAKDCEPILFGWQAMRDEARMVVICEGEIDALSWRAYGYDALSVPYGGGGGKKQQWIESEFDNLDRFETIYLGLDSDAEGDKAAAEIAKRLGRHRCRRVTLPHKDINECLVAGLDLADIATAMTAAKTLDPVELRNASSFAKGVVKLFWPGSDEHVGYTIPYTKIGLKVLFRGSELTLWTGKVGDGKSQILSDCMVDWIRQGSRVCLSSLEMRGEQTLKRMVKQSSAIDRPAEPYILKTLKWLDSGLWLYDHVGKSTVAGLLEIFDYARARYGCDQFVIDSLMRLGIKGDDYNSQEEAITQLVDWAIEHDVHVHLVAHARKGSGDKSTGPAETDEIKGAMEIGANAFNIISVWRNRKQEDLVEAEKDEERRAELIAEKALVVLNIAKQRNGDHEGKHGLWFSKDTYRYRSQPEKDDIGRQYVNLIEA